MDDVVRATRARIHLDLLRSNLRAIRRGIPKGTAICAAVKANAYGHGAIRVSRMLREEKVEVLGVSSPFEGQELRQAGDTGRILIFGPTVPEEVELTIEAGLETMVTDRAFLQVLEAKAEAAGASRIVPVHLKVDTGMGRVGCRPDEALQLARRIANHPKITLVGLATHFPSADSPDRADKEFTAEQAAALSKVASELIDSGIDCGTLHASNSGGLASGRRFSFAMVRPGIALYGYGNPVTPHIRLRPVMELVTQITALKTVSPGQTVSYGRTWRAERKTVVATLPVGYADGYPRLLSNRADVLIHHRRRPVAGTVCMDQTMVDLGEGTDVSLYDEAVLFGPDPEGPDAGELGELTGTIPYEIICGIGVRVPRVYIDRQKP